MKEKDVKVLWGRAAGRCAVCRTKLTQDAKLANKSFPLGEHAHIVGEKSGSARSDSILSDEERDGYTNRILLCPNDHTAIDKNETDWPVERLHMVKADHELWVELTLTTDRTVRDEANALIYSHVIDAVTERLRLAEFADWASGILEPYWRWPLDIWDGVEATRRGIYVTDWPGAIPELEVALDRATWELQEATAMFTKYSELDEGDFIARRWYKATLHPPDVYDRLDSDFWLWSDTLEQRVIEATKALNWARETWRREGNPMWLATQGWFSLVIHPDASLRYSYAKPHYTDEEKAELLQLGVGAADVRAPRVERR